MSRLLTVHEAAGVLGCSDNHVYRLVADGVLRAVDISRPGSRQSKTRLRADDLDSYIDSRTRNAKAHRRTA